LEKRFYIKTFGCQMNVRDSETMAALLHQAGYKYGSFDEKQLEEALEYAEELFNRALARK